MSGLTVAYTGSVTRPGEISTDDGKPFLVFNTVVDGVRLADETEARIKVVFFGNDAEALAARLVKYAEVHVEGRLSIWEGKDGRTGLAVVATRVEVLWQSERVIGKIGQARS